MFAGSIAAGMQYAGHAVSRLFSKGYCAIYRIKVNIEIDQVGNAVGGFIDEDVHRFLIAQASPSGHSVLIVEFR
jgi:hypothetical protein